MPQKSVLLRLVKKINWRRSSKGLAKLIDEIAAHPFNGYWKQAFRMNKKELITLMATRTGSSGAAADRAVNALIEIISDTLKKGDSLTLPGFGTFEVRERAARTGRNPKTGEELKIAASRIAAFKPGAALKAAVNGDGK